MEGRPEQTYPACFESEEQWLEFADLWKLSQPNVKMKMCHDCTPEWRDQMIRENRCAHPETVFVLLDGEVVGVNGEKWFSWISALTGKLGTAVVSQPSKDVRDRFIDIKRAEARAEGRYLLTPEQRARHKPNKKKEKKPA